MPLKIPHHSKKKVFTREEQYRLQISRAMRLAPDIIMIGVQSGATISGLTTSINSNQATPLIKQEPKYEN